MHLEARSHEALDYRLAFEAAPALLMAIAPDLTILDASDAYCRAMLTERSAIVGRPLFEVFPDLNPANPAPTGVANLRASLQRVLVTKQPEVMPVQRYDVGGPGGFEERYWKPVNVPVLGTDGEVRFILHRAEDVTTEVRLEATEARLRQEQAELRRNEALADSIVTNSPAGIIYYDRALVIRRVNPTITALLGLSAEAMTDRAVTDVFPGLDAEAHYGPVLRHGETVRQTGFEHRYEVDGVPAVRHWDFVNVPVYGPGGEIEGVLGMAVEVSERVEKERLQQEKVEALEQANVHKDQFLGILSHELRTPINAIMGFASILDDGIAGPLTGKQQGFVGKILGGSERLLRLIGDLLDMSRIRAGKFTITPAPLAIAAVVDEVLSGLSEPAAQRGIALRRDLAPGLPPVPADEQRLAQVLTNLVGNALKFTQAGGWIEVRARVEGGALRVEVEDNGPGVAPELQADLFEPFTQVDMSPTRQAGGVGLGLSICKSLIEAHGGRIGVGSRPGKGATFWFSLPLS